LAAGRWALLGGSRIDGRALLHSNHRIQSHQLCSRPHQGSLANVPLDDGVRNSAVDDIDGLSGRHNAGTALGMAFGDFSQRYRGDLCAHWLAKRLSRRTRSTTIFRAAAPKREETDSISSLDA
jgi:hypothetical protein